MNKFKYVFVTLLFLCNVCFGQISFNNRMYVNKSGDIVSSELVKTKVIINDTIINIVSKNDTATYIVEPIEDVGSYTDLWVLTADTSKGFFAKLWLVYDENENIVNVLEYRIISKYTDRFSYHTELFLIREYDINKFTGNRIILAI